MSNGLMAAIAALILGLTPNGSIASPHAAPPPVRVEVVRPSAEGQILLREAIFGFCMRTVNGQGLIADHMDTAGPDWRDVGQVTTTGGLQLFAGRAHKRTGLIVDIAPEHASCFVQGQSEIGGGLAQRLRDEIAALGAVVLDDQNTPQVRSVLYGFINPDGNEVPLIMLHEYGPPMSGLVSAVITSGQKGPAS